jgi:1,4-alpha-glucan branching enzyme
MPAATTTSKSSATQLVSATSLSEHDAYLFKEGTHSRLYENLGCHLDGQGARFAVWAPNAKSVSVIGDFNNWNAAADPLQARWDGSGIWEGRVADVRPGQAYKYRVESRVDNYVGEKADPFAFAAELAPKTASIVWSLDYEWGDADWMAQRHAHNALDAPISIYELHLGSWRKNADGSFLNYRQAAQQLVEYVLQMGFTHVELMPITEHPFYGSWGYQTTGYFAPTSRYGTPQDFMFFVDLLHRNGIGVILDWVPSHFPGDGHGLAYFDGTHLYEHADPRQGFHPEWKSWIFNYGRNEVRAFLLSSARFWLDRYHIDGIRVDAVASMLYLDYGRKQGEWIPNIHGGKENLDAIRFLREMNEMTYRDFPDTQTIAEESTSWPMVSRPNYVGGLGFGMKWNMGWMHDTLSYMSQDPVYRKFHHNKLTFSLVYAFSENFVLPISNDEVVYGTGSLLNKMPGDNWQQLANVRALLGYMWAHPGKKLLFMGCEIGQRAEWNHDATLDWGILQHQEHLGLQRWLSDVNRFYRAEPALSEVDFNGDGFAWIDCCDTDASVFSFVRKPKRAAMVLVVVNMTPVPRHNYVLGVPYAGRWREALNSDAPLYGGSGMGNLGGADSAPLPSHGHMQSLTITVPPLSAMYFRHEG